jgi:hypothetical protein
MELINGWELQSLIKKHLDTDVLIGIPNGPAPPDTESGSRAHRRSVAARRRLPTCRQPPPNPPPRDAQGREEPSLRAKAMTPSSFKGSG